MKKNFYGFIILLLILLIVWAGYRAVRGPSPDTLGPNGNATSTEQIPGQNSGETSADEIKAIKSLVESFGKQLQKVSLLDSAGVAKSMEDNYGAYLTPQLLVAWQKNPSMALGRQTSSPWPDRIEVLKIENHPTQNPPYEVQAYVIEVSNEGGGIGENPTTAARRPVLIRVVNNGTDTGSDWRISAVTIGPYAGSGNWVTVNQARTETSKALSFQYPKPLPTTYISTQDWPPVVVASEGDYTCRVGTITDADGTRRTIEKHMIDDREYCVGYFSEGAAGSTYTTYQYVTEYSQNLVNVYFTLRFPQCMNYDNPKQSECIAEQAMFDIDGLADRIVSSVMVK